MPPAAIHFGNFNIAYEKEKVVVCLKRVEFFSTHSAEIIKLLAFFFKEQSDID